MISMIMRMLTSLVLFPFFTVLGAPVSDICKIVLDDIDSKSRRFLYIRDYDVEQERCTYCSAITRTSTNVFLRHKEDLCINKNKDFDFKFDKSPICKYMEPMTCVIPNPVENGEWNCPCSGIDSMTSDEVLVYTNCTQSCKPGYFLVGDPIGHCGERSPLNKYSLTEFRHGNAKCVKYTEEPAGQDNETVLVIAVISTCGAVVVAVFIIVLVCLCRCNHWRCFKKTSPKDTSPEELPLSDISSNPSTRTDTQESGTTQSTKLTAEVCCQVPSKKSVTSPLLSQVEGAAGHISDFPSQDWKYGPESSKLEQKHPEVSQNNFGSQESLSAELPSGEPISGLSKFPERSSATTNNIDCNVHLSNLSLHRSRLWNEGCVLNEKGDNQMRLCYNMAIDILYWTYPEFDLKEIKTKLDLCEKGPNPVQSVLFMLLKCHPCKIGHVVRWCVEKGHSDLVQDLFGSEHENCEYCESIYKGERSSNF